MNARARVLLATLVLFVGVVGKHAVVGGAFSPIAELALATEPVPSPVPLPSSTPGPSPTPGANICASPLSITPGGTLIQFGQFELVLPAGFDYVWIRTGSADSAGAVICVPALNSSITISGEDGHELFRSVNNPAAVGLFAEILAAVHLQSCGQALVRVSGPTRAREGNVDLDLPAGTFVLSLGIADPGGGVGWTTVCYLEGNSEIRISNDCKELSRKVLRPEASAILDQVRSNARCAPPPSIPTPVPPASLASPGTVRPPNTGEAGLK